MSTILDRIRVLRRGWRFAWLGGAALLAAMAVSGCQVTTNLPCPATQILRDTSQLTRFAPGQPQTPDNILFVANVDDARLNCSYNSDNYERIDVALGVQISAHRTPGARVSAAEVRYFVAIVNLEGTVLAKKDFVLFLPFVAGSNDSTKVDQVLQRIPVKYPQNGGSLQVWVGFQLSDGELQYNRAHFGS